jgi:hypothetical protein
VGHPATIACQFMRKTKLGQPRIKLHAVNDSLKMKSPASKCAFCMRPAKMTGEHLWSEWMRGLFPDSEHFVFSKRLHPDTEITRWGPTRGIDLTAKVVCEQCNNGWMSDIESTYAAPAMKDIIRSDTRVVLDVQRLTSIAIFGFKAAVVGDHLSRGKAPFFSSSIRRRFRQTLDVPFGVQMWLACLGVSDPRQGTFRMRYGKTPSGATNGFHHYTFTYAIGRLCFQVSAARWTRSRSRRISAPRLTQNPAWDVFSIPFWPSDGYGVEWPPVQHLKYAMLNAFADRWQRIGVPIFPIV